MTSKINARSIISAVNLRAVAAVQYGARILKQTKEELKEMDRESKKILTMHGACRPCTHTNPLYMNKSNGR